MIEDSILINFASNLNNSFDFKDFKYLYKINGRYYYENTKTGTCISFSEKMFRIKQN